MCYKVESHKENQLKSVTFFIMQTLRMVLKHFLQILISF